jgi:Ni,Fe-hydrogenase III large subunit
MSLPDAIVIDNAESVDVEAIPHLSLPDLRDLVTRRVGEGGQLFALHGLVLDGHLRVLACVGDPQTAGLAVASATLPDSFPSFTPDCPQAHWFEREMAEQWGVVPEGHPWLHPIRFHASQRVGHDAWGRDPGDIRIGDRAFYRVEGDEVHEVAVGPVHAGVIEPGHFRFQCHGETVFHLEVSLGYQHRGVEASFAGGPTARTLAVAETIAGDSTIAHTTAYCHAVEALAQVTVPPRAEVIRAVALELERLANHVGDLGALAGDVAYLPTASFCGRLRGDVLNTTAALCGSRFGRGTVRPGGVGFDLEPALVADLRSRLDTAMRDVKQAVELLWNTPSVMARFESMGVVDRETARALGLVGPCARASGVDGDVRADYPVGYYRFAQVPVSVWETGDVFGRAFVRWLEVQRSAEFIRECLAALPEGTVKAAVGPLRPHRLTVALVEGWRGAVCHVATTDERGRLAHYKVVDPSFHNWMGLAMALRNNPISEFPLCNKSFNLSYCGHDL